MNIIKSDAIIEKIMDEVMQLDIAGYLKDEVKDLLKHLHFYKIKNVHQNIDALKDYLELLDKQSTNQIHKLEYDQKRDQENAEHNIGYYISKGGLEKIGEHKMHQKIFDNDYNLSYIMQGIKSLLLFTADEFCNATPTRMSINRLLRQKELREEKK